jgi:hypothetical protein
MSAAKNFGNQWYRHQVRAKTREAMRAKAARGHVAGGMVYGYANVEVGGQRSHVERQINEAEAAVLCRIFQEIVGGKGFTRVAKGLTADGVPSPRRHQGWAATGVREMVFRELYRGQLIYGKTRWIDKGGTKVKVDVPEAEWTRLDMPALRIIAKELWKAAHARLDRTRATYLRGTRGKLWGRPESGIESRYLLTGFLACSLCQGGMSATWSFGARGQRRAYYRCNTHRVPGIHLCTTDHAISLPGLDEDVLRTFREDVLTPTRLERVIRRAIELHTHAPGETADRRQALLAELRKADQELAQFTRAVAAGASDIPALVEAMRATQRRRDELAARLEHLDGLERAAGMWDRLDLTAELRARLAE